MRNDASDDLWQNCQSRSLNFYNWMRIVCLSRLIYLIQFLSLRDSLREKKVKNILRNIYIRMGFITLLSRDYSRYPRSWGKEECISKVCNCMEEGGRDETPRRTFLPERRYTLNAETPWSISHLRENTVGDLISLTGQVHRARSPARVFSPPFCNGASIFTKRELLTDPRLRPRRAYPRESHLLSLDVIIVFPTIYTLFVGTQTLI